MRSLSIIGILGVLSCFFADAQNSKATKLHDVTDVKLALVKKSPPELLINVEGHARTGGWTNARLSLRPGAAGGFLELDFVADPPSAGSIVPQVLVSHAATYVWEGDVKTIKGVRVHAETNSKEKLLSGTKEYTPSAFK